MNLFGLRQSIMPLFSVMYSKPAAASGLASFIVVAVATSNSSSLKWTSCVYFMVLSIFLCPKSFLSLFLGGVFGVPKRFYGVKVMTRELPFVVTCMSRSCFRKGLTLLWNLRGIFKDMRSYSYTCLLPRYLFLKLNLLKKLLLIFYL